MLYQAKMLRNGSWLLAGVMAMAVPSSAGACDLDGLPGFHRANPFSNAPMFRGMPLPTSQSQPAPPQRAADAPASSGNKSDQSQPSRSQPAYSPPQRVWRSDEGNGRVSAEDVIRDQALFR
ncbi:MAG: hypothetical protein ACXIT4_03305 [Erythrobacter sp.]